MKYNFTDRLRRVLALAREEAILLQHDYIGTEHLLLALIREGESPAVAVLQNLRVDLEEVVERVHESVRRGPFAPSGELPFTVPARSVLSSAEAEAVRLNHSYVGTDHLLPALMRERGIAAEVLDQVGVTLEAVRAETRRLLGEPPEPDATNDISGGLAHAWPKLSELKRSVAGRALSGARLSVIADADVAPVAVLAELLGALDGLHRAWGGGGLEWESGHVGVGAGVGAVL